MRSLFLLGLLTLTACGSNEHDSQYEKGSPGDAQQAKDVPTVAASQTDAGKGYATPSPTPTSSPTASPSPSPSPSSSPTQPSTQTPTQTPHQSPHQSPSAPDLTLRAMTTSGLGCPAGSVATNVSPDAKAFTLLFDAFTLNFDPDNGLSATSLACKVQLDLTTPPGWQVTVLTIDWRGFADLSAGASVRLDTTFTFSGKTPTRFSSTLASPLSGDYQIRAEATLTTATWSNCDAHKILTVDLGTNLLPHGSDAAILSVDTVDGELHHVAGLAWRRCN